MIVDWGKSLQPLEDDDLSKNLCFQSFPSIDDRSVAGFSEEAYARAAMELDKDEDEDEEDDFELVVPKRRRSSVANHAQSRPQPVPGAGGKRVG